MKHTLLFLFIMSSLFFNSCSIVKDGKPSIKQGVFGRVLWLEGNMMPSTTPNSNAGGKPASRTVNIYELTHQTEVEGQSPLFKIVKTKLVASVKSDANGYFQCKLAPGKYSVFTVEDDGQFFANLFEGNGEITPFEIKENQIANYNININYKAFY